ncbi:MAG TPA: hopanoid C-3 methylase HpnR [Rhizomicrobium sp.]|jgi:hopanoid C-3 methylase HpnR|nr:hopanoid C-3 methylase HpnR [Rhizomicrobium sp.]
MKLLAVHPSGLMFTRVFLRLEPLGLELVAAAARRAGHEVRICDLQAHPKTLFFRMVDAWRPDAICFSGNYLANIPEIIDLAKAARARLPRCFIFAGGHSVSFTAEELLEHGEGAIDCVLKGEGEASVAALLDGVADHDFSHVPGAVTRDGHGPAPAFVTSLDNLSPARDLLPNRRRYFIGTLDPCASVEFARGCPWDCTFCSAWTFYGRSYRTASPEFIAEDLARIRERGIFIVDDVAFVHQKHGMAIAEALLARGIRKEYYLETRCDVLLRNKEVFRTWRKLGLQYMFLGIEATDEETLRRYRKRSSMDTNMEAVEFARSLGLVVAINIIADPGWDHARFAALRAWCMEIPEIVNVSVATPYPGTEIWQTDAAKLTSRDYRLFDIQHAVMPTALPLEEFYEELVNTQRVLNLKHLGWHALRQVGSISARLLMRGQTNFIRSIWKFNSVFDPAIQMADHARPAKYELRLPSAQKRAPYIHAPMGRSKRALDSPTESFVEATRMPSAA